MPLGLEVRADMNAPDGQSMNLVLEAVAGPTSVSLPLVGPEPVTIGRRSAHKLKLFDPSVSRDHARLTCRTTTRDDEHGAEQWLLSDTGSTHGTRLNGVRLACGRQYPIRAGDLLAVGPWTLLVVDPSAPKPSRTTLATRDDAGFEQTIVSRLDARETESLAQQRLELLLKCSELIYSAPDEASLAQAVLDAAVSGTGYVNAAVLRPVTDDQHVEVVAHRGEVLGLGAAVQLSRSLIREAASGVPARLQRQASVSPDAASIVDLRIDEALCVPIKLESTLSGFLYLDNRAGVAGSTPAAPDAGAFATGLARLAALALANLMRLDIERRQERIEVELQAAAEAQRMLLPSRRGSHVCFTYIGESRPGRYVGGDFFDIVPFEHGRLAVALGDVAGSGISASLLVTASQGFLHAGLEQHGDPARAVTQLNHFFHSRCQDNSFMSLWVGVYDADARTLSYVDAGHGYAYLYEPDRSVRTLAEGDNLVIGVLPDYVFKPVTIPLPAGGRTLVVSDGIIEQRGAVAQPSDTVMGDHTIARYDTPSPQRSTLVGTFRSFGVEGLHECIQNTEDGEDEIAALLAALQHFAASPALSDDTTAVLVRWDDRRAT